MKTLYTVELYWTRAVFETDNAEQIIKCFSEAKLNYEWDIGIYKYTYPDSLEYFVDIEWEIDFTDWTDKWDKGVIREDYQIDKQELFSYCFGDYDD